MKAVIVALAGIVLLFHLPRADSATFEGVNLDELNQTQQLRDMPEIYERDPANGRRFKLRQAVVQLPLGEAWLSFNAERNTSYLNKVPGQNAGSYFGPIAGDVFEIFQLEESYIAKLRQDQAGDIPHRLGLILRTGNRKLRERALRIMTAGLAPEISADTRSFYLPQFRELAETLGGDDVAPLLAAIDQTTRRIEELTVTLPDSDYSPGNAELERQGRLPAGMKPGGPVPDAAWGAPRDGLRAAAVFSTTEPALGEDITVWLLVENVSDQEIRFGSLDVIQTARTIILGPDGKELPAKSSFHTGMSPIERHKLRPHERVTLARKTLSMAAKDDAKPAGFGGSRAASGPGEYRVRYESVLSTGAAWSRQEDGLMHRTYPARGEWSGHLSTAETTIRVRGQDKAASAEPDQGTGQWRPTDKAAGVPPELLPRRFKVESHGLLALGEGVRSRTVVWDGQLLTQVIGQGESKESRPPDRRTLQPTEAAWREFWDGMNNLHIRKWLDRYLSTEETNGSWSIVLEWGTNRVQSSGTGRYPDMTDVTKASRHPVMLNRFTYALDRLMAQPVEVDGRYFSGFEASIFRPAAGEHAGQRWWLEGSRAFIDRYSQLLPATSPTLRFANPEVITRVRGRLVGPGAYGHLNAYEYELIVEDVLEMKAAPANP